MREQCSLRNASYTNDVFPFQLFSVIIFGCISSKGWMVEKDTNKEVCLYNKDTNACNYGVGISVIAFVASIGFIAGEVLFEQMSSVKTRKHYVLGDMGFSGDETQWEYLPTNLYLYVSYYCCFLMLMFQLFGRFCTSSGFAISPTLGESLTILRKVEESIKFKPLLRFHFSPYSPG